MAREISETDKTIVDKRYKNCDRQIASIRVNDLCIHISRRIYTEWCCNGQESHWHMHMNYTGEAFKKWVDDETLYALERRSQQGLSNEGAMSEQVREDVLAALADRAIEVFGKWKGAYPSADDHTNLRASLQPYIQPRLS